MYSLLLHKGEHNQITRRLLGPASKSQFRGGSGKNGIGRTLTARQVWSVTVCLFHKSY